MIIFYELHRFVYPYIHILELKLCQSVGIVKKNLFQKYPVFVHLIVQKIIQDDYFYLNDRQYAH